MIAVDCIESVVQQNMAKITSLRRAIHANPETAFEELETNRLCCRVLSDLGVRIVSADAANTGIVALIEGARPGPTIALRTDMDGLPIQENTGLPFQSTVSGKMHACGHDGHVAIMLGVAMVLSRLRDSIRGNVKLIFQPAEEQLIGAKQMIADGALVDPPVDAVFGLHLWPDVPYGHVGIHEDVALAACDKVSVRIQGNSAHIARPHEGKNALTAACLLVNVLQSCARQEVDPSEPFVFGIGRLAVGESYNIVPEVAEFQGTARTVHASTRDAIRALVLGACKGIGEATQTRIDVVYESLCPPVRNNPDMVEQIVGVAKGVVGESRVHMLTTPSLIAEDFAHYLADIPGAMIMLGVGDEYPLHHPMFSFDERVLGLGVRILSELVMVCQV